MKSRSHMEFPKVTGVDRTKLVFTPEAEYSITRSRHGEEMLKHMRDKGVISSEEETSLIDATSNVGSDVIRMAPSFKHVYAVEWDPDNFAALEKNIRLYHLAGRKVSAIRANSVNAVPTILHHKGRMVVYMDPPWGGPGYKDQKELDLVMGEVRVDVFVQDLLRAPNKPAWILLKLPNNYAFRRLEKLAWVKTFHKIPIGVNDRKPGGAFQFVLLQSR
jgi:predicted RNA methylase